jgi:hypothetical protein
LRYRIKPFLFFPLLFIAAYFLFNTRAYFFDDEITTITVANLGYKGIWFYCHSSDLHPPLSYCLFKLWFFLFGESIAASQALSVILMALGIGAYIYVCRELFPRIGRFAGLISLHPLLILWGGAARYYPLLFFLSNLSTLFFIRLLRNYTIPTATVFIAVSILGLYSDINYGSVLLPQCCLLIISAFSTWPRQLKKISWVLLVIALFYLPWLGTSIRLFLNVGLANALSFRGIAALWYDIYCFFLGQSIAPYKIFLVIPALAAFILFFTAGISAMRQRQPRETLLWAWLFSGAMFPVVFFRPFGAQPFLFLCGLLFIPIFFFVATRARLLSRLLLFGFICGIFLYADTNILLRRDIHKASLGDPMPQILGRITDTALQGEKAVVVLYSEPLYYYLKRDARMRGKLLLVSLLRKEPARELLASLDRSRPSRVIYVWSYYGDSPYYGGIDNLILGKLAQNYLLVKEEKLVKDERWKEFWKFGNQPFIRPFMNPTFYYSFLNRRGYRYLIQDYRLKQ